MYFSPLTCGTTAKRFLLSTLILQDFTKEKYENIISGFQNIFLQTDDFILLTFSIHTNTYCHQAETK